MTESSPAGTREAVPMVGWPVVTAESQLPGSADAVSSCTSSNAVMQSGIVLLAFFSLFFIPLVLGLLNSLTEGASPRKSMATTKLRLRECTFSVVVTE